MNNRWTLHIRDFGKINSADITVAPITLFVGDNNSGKSYLMAILYALLNIRPYRQRYDFCENSSEYQRCALWLKKEIFNFEGKSRQRILITTEMQGVLETLLNKILAKNKEKLALYAFNSEVSIGEISISLPRIKDLHFTATYEDRHDGETTFYMLSINPSYNRARSSSVDVKFFLGFILEYLIKSGFKHAGAQDCIFLPTSRTGFLLTYKSLVRASISDAYDSNDSTNSATSLTRPCSDFLKNLSAVSPELSSDKYADIISYIENNMAYGHITLSDGTPQTVISYRPNSADYDIPLHLTSGVVTELAPLMLMLGYHSPFETLFIEEPEMGLHPALQFEMAKILIRIHAKGIPLFVTTHSDIILQHFNNMIKLSAQDSSVQKSLMEQYSYAEEDIVTGTDVAMYQFDVCSTTGKANVTQLSRTEYGFLVPTFNNALEKILRESRQMEGSGEDGDI